jgi:hypothetical protein
MPGAVLVTPVQGTGVGAYVLPDGAVHVSGFLSNSFNRTSAAPALRTRFEIASQETLNQRVKYETYSANKFLGDTAAGLELTNPQELPRDAGYLSFQSDSSLRLAGKVLTQATGLGAKVDISSTGSINILGAGSSTNGIIAGQSNLDASNINSWGAASLLIGGIRHEDSTGKAKIEVRTNQLTINNGDSNLSAVDLTLASTEKLTIANDSKLESVGNDEFKSDEFVLNGDGTLIRLSADENTVTQREGFANSDKAMMTIGSNVAMQGNYGLFDSTYGTSFAADTSINAKNLILGSGHVSIAFENATGLTAKSLVLSGDLLANMQQVANLTLRSYSGIDIYGNGTLGGAGIGHLSLLGKGIRAYNHGDGDILFEANQITFGNPNGSFDLPKVSDTGGSLQVTANSINLASGDFTIGGFQDINLSALDDISFDGKGSLQSAGNIQTHSPFITGSSG